GGAAGGLSGAGGAGSYGGGGVGGTQTAGGANNGGFGTGGFGTAGGGGFGGAGGGGYYGGGGAGTDGSGDDDRGGGGGSSFISGFIGCNAVISQTNGVLSGQPNHYSGLVFTNTQMAAGNASMPNHNGLGSRTGNSGTGFAKITLLVCDSVD
ncbi:MAG: hypothetical protein LBO07_06790, partial [Coriobacteriales bacterium]|nr:hypothetical protein [Coriobacteriales bacterium]